MNMKHILGCAIALSLPYLSSAQITENVNVPVISKTPVSTEAAIRTTLFEVNEGDVNYYFRANLPGNQYLVIQFRKIGDWPVKGSLKQMFATADNITTKVSDSFSNPAIANSINIHLPINNEPITLRLSKTTQEDRLLFINGRMQGPLKVGMDTISILKTYQEVQQKQVRELNQVQYSFILKNISNIHALANNEALINQIENEFDELVQKKRTQWTLDNAWFHGMNAEYSANTTGNPKLRTEMTHRFIKDAFGFQANLGASILGTGIAPYFNYGLSFKWSSRQHNEFHFLRVSFSTLSMIETLPSKHIEAHGAIMANLESGRFYYNKKTRIPLYEISAGIGTKITPSNYAPLNNGILRVFVNYSLTKAITITPDMYFLQHISSNASAQVTGGLTLSLRLF